MHRLLLKMLLGACLTVAGLGTAQAASFDCSKAGTPVEKMICHSDVLSSVG
jgi:uncharacterized protein